MIKKRMIAFMSALFILLPACGRMAGDHEAVKKDVFSSHAPHESNTPASPTPKDGEESHRHDPENDPADKPENYKDKLTIPDEIEILQKIDADIDSDNINELIIIDTKPEDYVRLLIFKDMDCIFNSEDYGITIEKESLSYFEGDILLIDNNSENPLPEIYLTVCGMDMDELAIIEDYKIIFYGPLFGYEFVDLDEDGQSELCGCSDWGGQVMFNSAQYSSFRYESGEYVYSEDLTWIYYRLLCARAEAEFQENPSFDSFDFLVSLYARLGEREKGHHAIKSFVAQSEGHEEYYDEELFMKAFEHRLEENGF